MRLIQYLDLEGRPRVGVVAERQQPVRPVLGFDRSEEHTSELQSH